MGEIADGLVDGTFDYITGEYLGEGPGFPRSFHDNYKPLKRVHTGPYSQDQKIAGITKWLYNKGFETYASKIDAVLAYALLKKWNVAEDNWFINACNKIQDNWQSFSGWILSNRKQLLSAKKSEP